MRVVATFLIVGILAACAYESGAPSLPSDQVRAYFPSGGVADAIEVDATNRLPLRTAELVAPNGDIFVADGHGAGRVSVVAVLERDDLALFRAR